MNQCSGSFAFWKGSLSAEPYYWIVDPDPALSSVALKMQTRNSFFSTFFCVLLMYQSSFSSFSCLSMEEAGSGSVQIITYPDSEHLWTEFIMFFFVLKMPVQDRDSHQNVLFCYLYPLGIIDTVISCCCRWLTFLVVRNGMCSTSLDPTCDWALWRPPWASSRRSLQQASRQAF